MKEAPKFDLIRLKEGGVAEWFSFVEQHQGKIRGLVRAMGIPPDDIDDVVQETLIALRNRFANIDGSVEINENYVLKAAQKKSFTYHQRKRNRWLSSGSIPLMLEFDDAAAEESSAVSKANHNHQLSPEDHVVFDESGTTIIEAIKSLDPRFQIPVILACAQGFSYREIAQHAQIPEGTVMSRLNRARTSLKKTLPKDVT